MGVRWVGPWYIREPNTFIPERRWVRHRRTCLSANSHLAEMVLGPVVA